MNVADARRIFKHRLSKACLLLLILSVAGLGGLAPIRPRGTSGPAGAISPGLA